VSEVEISRAIPRARAILIGIGLLVGTTVLLLLLVDFQNFMDLEVYRAGGRAWLDGFSLYSNQFSQYSGVGLPFIYPPVSAILFTVLAVIPEGAASVAITAASLLSIAAVAAIVLVPRHGRRAAVVLLVLTALTLSVALEPVRQTLGYGQINLLLMILVVADCLMPRTWWPRGLLIGIAAAVKLTPIIFLLYFFAHRQWRPMVTAIAGFVGVSLLAWIVLPSETPKFLATVISDPGGILRLEFVGNQSLNGFWHRMDLSGPLTTAAWFATSVVVVALAGYVVYLARRAGDDLGALLAVAIAGLLASPISWSHHWVWAIPAGLWLAPKLRHARWPGRVAAFVGFTVFVVPPHWLMPARDGSEMHWAFWQQLVGNEFVWIGIASLVALVVYFRKSRAGSLRDAERPEGTPHGGDGQQAAASPPPST
jgi:alpha-1,2-mannosyltransferase